MSTGKSYITKKGRNHTDDTSLSTGLKLCGSAALQAFRCQPGGCEAGRQPPEGARQQQLPLVVTRLPCDPTLPPYPAPTHCFVNVL